MAGVSKLGRVFGGRYFYCPSETYFGQVIPRQYPDIWMPLEYALAMYWRVKKWRFSYSKSWAETGELGINWTYSSSQEFFVGQLRELVQAQDIIAFDPREAGPLYPIVNYLFGEPPETEKKLSCGVDLIEGEILVTPDYGDPYLEPVSYDWHFGCSLGANPVQSTGAEGGTRTDASIIYDYANIPVAFYRTSDFKFRPAIRFSAKTFRWTQIYAAPWSGTTQDPIGTFGTFSYILLGQTFSAPIYAYNTRHLASGWAGFLNMTASLEAIEYWPYDPQDGGGPFYNTTTGEQLRNIP